MQAPKTNTLTTRQNRALAALLTAKTHGEAATMAGIAPRTLRGYLANPTFKRELLAAEGEARAALNRRLTAGADGAVEVLAEVMQNPDNSPTLRLAAARTWLEYFYKAGDYSEFEKRLTELEERILTK